MPSKKNSDPLGLGDMGIPSFSDGPEQDLFADLFPSEKPQKVKKGKQKKVKKQPEFKEVDIFSDKNLSMFGDSSSDSMDIFGMMDYAKDDIDIFSSNPQMSNTKTPKRKKDKVVRVSQTGDVSFDLFGNQKEMKQTVKQVQDASVLAGDAFNQVGKRIRGVVTYGKHQINERRGNPTIDRTSLDKSNLDDPNLDKPQIKDTTFDESGSTHDNRSEDRKYVRIVVTGLERGGNVKYRKVAQSQLEADQIQGQFQAEGLRGIQTKV